MTFPGRLSETQAGFPGQHHGFVPVCSAVPGYTLWLYIQQPANTRAMF